jgi:hypothetical protein
VGTFELLSPRGLWLLSAIAPLLLLYVLKVRRRRESVASTWLFQEARRDLVARHPFRRLLPETALVVQLLAVVVLSLALARPSLRKDGLDGDVLAIVVDASASMGTSSGSMRRIDLAKAAARRAIEGSRPGTRTFVVVDAGMPRLLGAPETVNARTLRGLDGLEPEDVEGNLQAALSLATDRLRELPGRKTILVVTDGAVADPSLPSSPGAEVHVEVVGDARENTGVVRIASRAKGSTKPGTDTVEVFGALRHSGKSPRDVHVTVTVEGEDAPRASRRLLVEPGKDVPVVLGFEARAEDHGKVFYFQESPSDALAVDDIAYGIVPKGHAMPVTLVTEKPFSWLERALQADPDVALQKVAIADLERVNVDEDALVVVEGACPEKRVGHDALIVGPPEGRCFGVEVGHAVDVPKVTSWDPSDPRFRFASLDGVRISRATPLLLPSPIGVLMRSDRGVLAIDAGDRDRSTTLLGFDVGNTDWPLRASFVLFVRNVVELARTHRSQGASSPLVTGGTLRIPVPPERENTLHEAELRLDGDPSFSRKAITKGGFLVVSPISRAGVYRVSFAGAAGTLTRVASFTNATESDTSRKEMSVGGIPTSPNDPAPEAHREWTALFAWLGTLLVLTDVLLFAKRRTTPKKPSARRVA